ncbi:hypothetical protein EC9_06680 [Rosistilla ulvae]|uniref:Outer membrane efflux protein n=1 Tax=Rosistilla ulvae TaxID=1930277 RepID=A0A517LV54_9BACT|nr:hypothetical protein [Rosistilla ulvae]QDS86504.1 hypothetical protein EC9_06680 [Rosistilla ulvae]
MATLRHSILLIPTATILVIAGATLAWTQDKSGPQRINPLVVSEPRAGSILVEEVPDRQRPAIPPPVSRPQPKRLPPVNDLATPHVVVPHRLEGEYSIRKESAAANQTNQKPVPAIEQADEAVLPVPQPAVENRPLQIPGRGGNALQEPADAAPQSRELPRAAAEEPPATGGIEPPQPQIESDSLGRSPSPSQPKSRVLSELLPQTLRSDGPAETVESETIQREMLPSEPLQAEPIDLGVRQTEPRGGSAVESPGAKGHVIQEPIGGQAAPAPGAVWARWSPWWQDQVQTGCHLDDPQKVAVDLDQLITIALQHSPLLEIVRLDGMLPQTGGYGMSRLTLRYGRPQTPGCDPTLMSEQIFIARHRTAASRSDTCAKTADMLLQIADAYWNVYRLRGLVAIGQRHHDAALALYEQSSGQYASERDRQRFVKVEATIRQRRADVNSTRISLKQAQNELAFLVSVPGWQKDIELMPQDVPCECDLQRSESTELELAMSQRAEVQAVLQHLQSLGPQSQHQLASSRFPQPSVAELRASQELEVVMDLVRLDVKDAMLKLRGNFAQMRLEAETAEKVVEELAVLGGNSSIEAILEAQDRLRTAESNYLNSLARYNVAILQLRRASGLLFVETPL